MIEHTDLIIDAVAAFFYIGLIFHAAYALVQSCNKGLTPVRIILIFFIVTASLYIYQTVVQFVTGEFANKNIWDILNFIQAVASMMAVHLIAKMSGISLLNKDPNGRWSRFP